MPLVGNRYDCDMSPQPNFFIVGAPKCGTTSLYEALRQQPLVFMPYDSDNYWKTKEPCHFCPDLIAREHLAISDRQSYLQLFANAGTAQRIGESSALYLFSKLAANAIYDFYPNAKIIILLREPVAMMRSWHADCLRHGHEDVVSFQRAIELEESRSRGEQLPRGSGYPLCLQYRAMAHFTEQIERFENRFGSQQIKTLLLEDLKSVPQASLDSIREFLELPRCSPIQLVLHNEGVVLNRGQLLKSRWKNRLRGYTAVRWARRYIPADFDGWLNWGLQPLLRGRIADTPVDTAVSEAFIAQLRQQMAGEVERLANLIERDLSHWQVHATPLPAI